MKQLVAAFAALILLSTSALAASGREPAPPGSLEGAPAPAIDYEIGNWYTSQHPSSHFRHQLVAARTTADARHGLRDNRLTIRHVGGAIEQRYLSADEIEAALADTFLLTPEPGWRRAIERAATAEVQA